MQRISAKPRHIYSIIYSAASQPSFSYVYSMFSKSVLPGACAPGRTKAADAAKAR